VKKFLIIQTAFIGDVILATPLIEKLFEKFPNSQIDFLVKKGNESLLQNNSKLNEILVFDKSKKLKSILQLIKKNRSKQYDAIVNLHRFASSGIITFLSGAQKKYGFSINPFSFCYTKRFKHKIGNGTHEVERNLFVISELVEFSFYKPKLYPSAEDERVVDQFKIKDYICLAPASVWFTKQMPEQKWIELVHVLKERIQKIYLMGGPSDYDLCERIKNKFDIEFVENLSGKLSFMQSAALMRDAKMNFVNDSGPLHIASAVNAPVTAFFCSTTPVFGFGPLSDQSQVIEVENLACKPCGLHGHKQCPKGHFDCGNKLSLSHISL
jgi:lipopolysaccharide heptosyltransferase II